MAFQQGLSGLNATSKNLSVIGNNIANSGTYGAKSGRAEFSDIYANAIGGGNRSQIGIGVALSSVSQQFTQGNITTTDRALDLAINGGGFFQLDSGGTTVFSRNGQFHADKAGFVVNNGNQKLLGYGATFDGTIIPSAIKPLQLPTAGVAPLATTKVKLELNLDSRQPVTLPAAGPPIDLADPKTYNFATSTSAFDIKGQEIGLTYYFQKTAKDTFDVYVTANGVPVLGTPAAPTPVVTGMNFDPSGATLLSPLTPTPFDVPAVPLTSGGISEPIVGVNLDLGSTTQYGAATSVTDLVQDGYAPGTLSGFNIDASGVIVANYSNGQNKPVGQLVLATFHNPQALQPLGGNAWASNFATGDAIIGPPGQGNLGALQAGALEESNVDLTTELVSMITAQRAYQANAQSIKTEDQILQTLVNLR